MSDFTKPTTISLKSCKLTLFQRQNDNFSFTICQALSHSAKSYIDPDIHLQIFHSFSYCTRCRWSYLQHRTSQSVVIVIIIIIVIMTRVGTIATNSVCKSAVFHWSNLKSSVCPSIRLAILCCITDLIGIGWGCGFFHKRHCGLVMGRGISGERSRGEGRINIASVQLDLCRYCCIYELVCDFYASRGGVATKAVQSVNLCFYVAFERSYRRRSGLRKQMFLHITVSPTALTQLVCFSLQLVSECQWETTIWNVARINFNF